MAYERVPVFKFDGLDSTGVDSIPVGALVILASNGQMYFKTDDSNLDGNTTVESAINLGAVQSTAADNADIWDYYYYADPTLDRVVVMDPKTMTMVSDIELSEDAHPGSIDRAGYTDKMYARTTRADPIGFDVIDARTRKLIKTVPLNHRPRAAGAYNKYRNLQLISTKDEPYVNIIDVDTDDVVGTLGEDHGTLSISGNCGGNATGHSIWLDKDHFTLIDRYRSVIRVYKIEGEAPPYNYQMTQELSTPSACHTIDVDIPSRLLKKRTFYAEIEGYEATNSVPQIWRLDFDSATGHLTQSGSALTFPGIGATDKFHHYSISPDGKYLWQPSCLERKVFVVDLDTWSIIKTYNIGLGGGHVNFSTPLDLAVVTNHFDQDITIINYMTDEIWNVKVSDDPNETDGNFIQSHLNFISPDGNFFYIFAHTEGIFVEVDLRTKQVSRTYETGGNPEQSSS